ncbi:MAG: hypothetical protein V1869_00605 [Candidatus Omnitrophota bacterium]
MPNKPVKNISWDFLSKFIIAVFFFLQCVRWSVLLQSMDIYYHLLTAWGFIQAGGYSGWDFWQFAPVGRPHIYPPFFHLVLAGLIKAGISQIILAKLCEIIAPSLFLLVLWKFARERFDSCFAFFVNLAFFSSFSFYLSLANHIPATLTFIFGILAVDQFFKGKLLRSSILLALCFYTHIGLSWFFALTFIFYAFINKEERKGAVFVLGAALILASPMIIKEVNCLKYVSALGLDMHEKYSSKIKAADLLFSLAGLVIALRQRGRYGLFAAFFVASSIFLVYPYRFFSAEGYFPVVMLLALFLSWLYRRFRGKILLLVIALFTLVFSPTLSLYKKNTVNSSSSYKINVFDAGFVNLLLAKGQILWFPNEYLATAKLVKDNSQKEDIVFCSLDFIGLTISSLAGRATANALLPEIRLFNGYNPFLSSKIIIFTQVDDPVVTGKAISALKLIKLGENDFFVVYRNPACKVSVNIRKALIPFWLISIIATLALLAFWQAGKIEKPLNKFIKKV